MHSIPIQCTGVKWTVFYVAATWPNLSVVVEVGLHKFRRRPVLYMLIRSASCEHPSNVATTTYIYAFCRHYESAYHRRLDTLLWRILPVACTLLAEVPHTPSYLSNLLWCLRLSIVTAKSLFSPVSALHFSFPSSQFILRLIRSSNSLTDKLLIYNYSNELVQLHWLDYIGRESV